MPDEIPKKKPLSEISHLFLSSVRDNATGGTRPKRLPPGSTRDAVPQKPRPDVSIDLTPEEFAQVFGGQAPTEPAPRSIGPISAVIGSHLNGSQLDRVRQYARHLAGDGKRIGLIEIDNNELRVRAYDRDNADLADGIDPLELHEPRQLTEALNEMAWDIDRWILLTPNPRLPEAHALLHKVNHWVLLSTCDHDGVVSCYRAIKGLLDTHRPRLSLALLNPGDQVEAGRVHRKIAGVCQQFLNWPMEAEPAVQSTDDVSEHLVIVCRTNADLASTGIHSQWHMLEDFVARSTSERPDHSHHNPADQHDQEVNTMQAPHAEVESPAGSRLVTDVIIPVDVEAAAEVSPSSSPRLSQKVEPMKMGSTTPTATPPAEDDSEITDLPSGETTEAAVLSAVLKKPDLGLIECPVKAPMCPQAMLAVNRDHRLVILAVARQGLAELRSIGQAYRWVIENRPLLSMALPQFSIDTHALPCLRLLVDHADLSADLLQPMLQAGNVTVQTYRKLRWGGKTGLLLEAA